MELQRINIEAPIPYPITLDEETALFLSDHQPSPTLVVITEREEFVKHIEAYCDCV